nr:hypothetical protein [uncultured Lichenicoccus sp.]
MTETTKTPNMDQVIARLREMPEVAPFFRRVVVVEQANSDLFDAAEALSEWLRTVPVEARHIARFNRFYDAIAGVREAHQMEPNDVRR